ncbi:MAG: nucleotidyltransferase [Phycisphaera sp.]|nr:nucleotidyltransferase [Phycisphaera sp.]
MNVQAIPPIKVNRSRLAEVCRRHGITRLALFGSVLRDDFGPDSDVDVLIDFSTDAHPTLFDLSRIQDELESVFNRRVDLLTRRAVERSRNEARKREILETAKEFHAA